MEELLVDSLNFSKTFGIAKSDACIIHNNKVLEPYIPQNLSFESDMTMVVFQFGKYVVIVVFTLRAITKQYFFDYAEGIDKVQLPLLMQTKVSDALIEQFLDIQFNLQMNFKKEDDTAILSKNPI